MATQSSSSNAIPALFNQFQGPPQRAYSGDMILQHTDRLNIITSDNDAEADDTSTGPNSSSRKRSNDAHAYPRKRATIAVSCSFWRLFGILKFDSANFAGGENRVAMAQDQGANCAPNYVLNVSIENRA